MTYFGERLPDCANRAFLMYHSDQDQVADTDDPEQMAGFENEHCVNATKNGTSGLRREDGWKAPGMSFKRPLPMDTGSSSPGQIRAIFGPFCIHRSQRKNWYHFSVSLFVVECFVSDQLKNTSFQNSNLVWFFTESNKILSSHLQDIMKPAIKGKYQYVGGKGVATVPRTRL